MPEAGTSEYARLSADPFDGTTDATLTVVRPDGTTAAQAVSSSDGGATWVSGSPVTYSTAGLWRLRWTVTGTGEGQATQTIAVAPAAGSAGRAYATSTDLANWMQAAPPADADRLLAQATVDVDDLLLTARYNVDADGMPTDAEVIAALRDATCELVSWWEETGDEHGAASVYGSVSIGSVSLSRGGAGGKGATTPRIGPKVRAILSNAGLLGHEPLTW